MTPAQAEARRLAVEARRAERGEVTEAKIGARTLRAGDLVEIARERGLFKVLRIRVVEGEVAEVFVFGGAGGREKCRTFTADRVGPHHNREKLDDEVAAWLEDRKPRRAS